MTLHDSLESARATGYRPCKRCRPDSVSPEAVRSGLIARACRLLDESLEPPPLSELAAASGMSSSHFHRLFKALTGLTPKEYAAGRRAERVRDGLGRAGSVTGAMYDAGFNSSGRFYEQTYRMLGMTPGAYRSGGVDEQIRFAVGQSSFGAILVASSEKGVVSILIGDEPEALVRDLQDRFPRALLIGGDAQYEERVAQVVGFVEAPDLGLDLPLDVRGTAFQRRVWQALREIPPGSTASYSEIARAIGAPKASRAVASACASNPIAVAIPCHRVVRNNGSLSGYRWGVERKRALIERERGRSSLPR